MEFHVGRLVDHVHLRVADLEKSKNFYRAALAALGRPLTTEDSRHFSADELYVSALDDPHSDGSIPSHVHLAFQASGPEMVAAFHAAAIGAGGVDNGGPGERPYHPGYFGAFVLDPDGNNIEAVWHGPATRSAASVVVRPGPEHPIAG